jgi:hypothetical protein
LCDGDRERQYEKRAHETAPAARERTRLSSQTPADATAKRRNFGRFAVVLGAELC